MRKHLSERDKQYIGTYCCNCGSTEDIQYHHIVPLALGGNNVVSNMCCLCGECHSKIHYSKPRPNISAATKAGLERARKSGKQLGHKHGTTFTTKKSLEAKAIILRNSVDFHGKLDDIEVLHLCNVSRNSYYKYKRELRCEKDTGADLLFKYPCGDTCEGSTAQYSQFSHSDKYQLERLI